MGYRSEVALALTDDATRLLKAIEEHVPSFGGSGGLLTDAEGSYPGDIIPGGDNWCKLYWGGIKWYTDGYDEISSLQEFMDGIPDEDFLFVRSGEDLEDNEWAGDFYDSEMYISKSLQWN